MQYIGGQPADVPVAEEELATEVALFNDVVISHGDLAHRSAGHAHHCKVLSELAAQRTSSHQKYLQVLQLSLHRSAKHAYLAIVAASLQGNLNSQDSAGTNAQRATALPCTARQSTQVACLGQTDPLSSDALTEPSTTRWSGCQQQPSLSYCDQCRAVHLQVHLLWGQGQALGKGFQAVKVEPLEDGMELS